jgi:hypothetical protein
MNRQRLERQLESAKSKLDSHVAVMDKAGVSADDRASCPTWRSLDADRRSIVSRLHAVGKIEKVNAERPGSGEEASEEE